MDVNMAIRIERQRNGSGDGKGESRGQSNRVNAACKLGSDLTNL